MKRLTYKIAGVDIPSATQFKQAIKPLVRKSFRAEVLKDIGGFGSFFRLAKNKFCDPILVSSSDGVGTKLKIASLVNKHDTVGIDAVAMNVNDILCVGAEPLFFLDYIAYSKAAQSVLVDVVKGLTQGCLQAGCSLIGGETAQMPDMYSDGEYDIAGFCVGVVEKSKAIDGSGVKPGDRIIGLASSGLHSNGYSLVRKVFSKKELKRLAEELLVPTRIYVKPVLSFLRNNESTKQRVSGIAHITGGAFYDKIARILPSGVNAVINKGSWPVPKLFQLIQQQGGVDDKEMYHTLNMGIGMAVVVNPTIACATIAHFNRYKIQAWQIGEIVKGKQQVVLG
ncbi:MAG: phosphoribosylformylglycinamidine cyclo-ligase [Candidatus Omnitrophica bacterium]|nr:phosphoribosylformylglycinamidine cyclo-ligase [Candidatus Omnitrophota bacterium]